MPLARAHVIACTWLSDKGFTLFLVYNTNNISCISRTVIFLKGKMQERPENNDPSELFHLQIVLVTAFSSNLLSF